MALTITTRLTDTTLKGATLKAVSIAFDSSYPTGGEAIVAADLGLDSAIDIFIPAVNGANFAVYDRTNGKLLLYTADGTEASASSDQSAVSVDAIVLGR